MASMDARTLILAGAVLALFGCADQPPQPAPVAQRTWTQETPEQEQREMHIRSVASCVAYGSTPLECEVRAQMLETCLATKNFEPCRDLAADERDISAKPDQLSLGVPSNLFILITYFIDIKTVLTFSP